MRVLVTGALGALGLATARVLDRHGHRVRAFDLDSPRARKRSKGLPAGSEVVRGDVTDPDAVRRAVEGCDAVIHDAAILPPVAERIPEVARRVNVGGTENLIRAIEETGGATTLVFPSSISVHGPDPARTEPVTADGPTRATDLYTETKIACEEALRASSIPWVILRVGVAIGGPLAPQDRDVIRFMLEVDPANPVEVVHASDVALAQVHAVERPAARGKVLLIGGGKRCRVHQRDITGLMLAGLDLPSIPERAYGSQPFYTAWMDTTEAQRILEFQRHSFDEIRESMLARLKPFRWLLRLARPVSRRWLLGHSGPWKGDPPRSTWREFVGST